MFSVLNGSKCARLCVGITVLLVMLAALAIDRTTATAEEVVNLYSYRQPFLIKPMLKEFTKKNF